MRAVRYDAPSRFAVSEVPTGAVGPRDVRIRVDQVGVCGTDLHLHHGDFNAVFPFIPGHEMVGTVHELGADVTRFHLGEQVTVNPNVYCGRCAHCLAGRLVQCTDARGMGSSSPGFFADFATVDEQQVFSVDGLAPDVAVFTEPAACAMHGLETLEVRPGSSALVIGAGPTGLLLAQLIARGGATSVTVADIVAFKLDTAAALGIDQTVVIPRGGRDVRDTVDLLERHSPRGDGYDVVVEATGVTAVGEMCVPLTRSGGTVLIYGVTRAEDRLSISPFDVFRREITIKGSFAEMTSFGAAIDALRTGRIRTDGIITHRFPLHEYGAALSVLTDDPAAHKVVITVRDDGDG